MTPEVGEAIFTPLAHAAERPKYHGHERIVIKIPCQIIFQNSREKIQYPIRQPDDNPIIITGGISFNPIPSISRIPHTGTLTARRFLVRNLGLRRWGITGCAKEHPTVLSGSESFTRGTTEDSASLLRSSYSRDYISPSLPRSSFSRRSNSK